MYSHCQGSALWQVIRLYIFLVAGWRVVTPLNIVVVHRFSRRVTVMQEEYRHSPKHSHSALSAFRDLLPDSLHADVSRQLAFTSRGVDSGWRERTFKTQLACLQRFIFHVNCGKYIECTKTAEKERLSSQPSVYQSSSEQKIQQKPNIWKAKNKEVHGYEWSRRAGSYATPPLNWMIRKYGQKNLNSSGYEVPHLLHYRVQL